MQMSSAYAKQKFYEAVLALVGTRPIQERLTFAAESLVSLRLDDLPEEMQGDYAALRLLLTHEPLSSETGPRPRHFHDEDSQQLAQKILSMYTELMARP
jgi:hypothetical protein